MVLHGSLLRGMLFLLSFYNLFLLLNYHRSMVKWVLTDNFARNLLVLFAREDTPHREGVAIFDEVCMHACMHALHCIGAR